MGSCTSQPTKRQASPTQQTTNNNEQAIKTVPKEEGPTNQKAIPSLEEQVKTIEKQDILEEKCLVEQQVRKERDAKPNQMRELLLIVQRVYHHYYNHDVDSSVREIDHFNSLFRRLQTEGPMSQTQMYQQLAEQFGRWSKEERQSPVDSKQAEDGPQISAQAIYRHEIKPYDRKIFDQIRKEHDTILQIQEEIGREGWEEREKTDELTIYTRREEDKSVGVLMEMDLRVPFEIFVSVITEIDLYKDFVPFTEVSRQEKSFARNCKVGYSVANMPVLARRETHFQAIGYSRLRTNHEFFLYTRSLQQKQELQDYLGYKVVSNQDYVQIIYKYFTVKYRPISDNYGRLTMASNADFGINFLPNFVLDIIVRTFAKDFIASIIKVSQEFKGSEWEKRIKKNPEMFLWFKKEIDHYLGSKTSKK